jgi:hypothetical protein
MESEMAASSRQKQINIRVESDVYRSMEALAQEDRRTIPQTARLLLEEGLRHRVGGRRVDDISTTEIAALAVAGGAFDWLDDEPDLYDDTCGEPI